MNIEKIRTAHENDGSIDAWGEFVLDLESIDGGFEFIDYVEDRVASLAFPHAVTVEINSDAAFANACFFVAASAFRAGEYRDVAAALHTRFWD